MLVSFEGPGLLQYHCKIKLSHAQRDQNPIGKAHCQMQPLPQQPNHGSFPDSLPVKDSCLLSLHRLLRLLLLSRSKVMAPSSSGSRLLTEIFLLGGLLGESCSELEDGECPRLARVLDRRVLALVSLSPPLVRALGEPPPSAPESLKGKIILISISTI